MTHERSETTLMKAKELRPLAEKLITTAKSDGLAARRRVQRWIPDRDTVKRVFETIAPRFVDRPGGYTRILRLGNRRGDNAEVAILEFVDFQFKPKDKGPKESLSDRAPPGLGAGRDRPQAEGRDAEEGGVGSDAREAKAPRKRSRPAESAAKRLPDRPEEGSERTARANAGTSSARDKPRGQNEKGGIAPLFYWSVGSLSEGRSVGHRRQRPLRVVVRLHGPRLGVRHRDPVLDVGERSVEDPELPVDRPRVEHLHDELDVVGREEPEVPGVSRQGDGRADAAPLGGTAG